MGHFHYILSKIEIMKTNKPIYLFIILSLVSCFLQGFAGVSLVRASSNMIYDDVLGAGWQDWSWAQVNLAATSPVHAGSHSIAVTFAAWQGLYLHHADIDTLGLTHLRFYVHGGSTGGQRMNVFMNLDIGDSVQNGPAIPVPVPAANSWNEVQLSLVQLNPNNHTVAGITWQDSSGGSQPTFYLDDISLLSPQDPNAPQLSAGNLTPRSIPADGLTTLVVRITATDPQGAGDIAAVTMDASSLGRGSIVLTDDGRNNDGVANDGLYGAVLTIPTGTVSGERRLLVTATDQAGHASNLSLGALNILAPPGGSIPAALPAHFGWGTNAWSETPGQDWQVNSGVPWNYVYQYITYGWESWGDNFVSRFVNQAWDKDFIPMVTVYMMLGVPTNCGEGGACYAQKLQNSTTVQNYLDSIKRAAQEAQGSKPVIFNLEPDFYGAMQQLSNSTSRPPGVQPNDPTSYPVALNQSGYPDNLAGFGQYLVDLIHATAPNALVAPMASMWATNSDPQAVTYSEAIQMAQSTAAFIDAMGGAQADLLIVEWSDRDAGSGLRPWWDDTDFVTPRPTRAILWENALSNAAHKRLLLWQTPVGNMTLDNTCDHYQDNRAAYVFNHPRDLMDAGVIGVLFGGGADCMTQVDTDGGFIAAQGVIAYALPGTPVGLSAVVSNGNVALLHWNENTEPDIWQYRLNYRQNPGSTVYMLNVGRRNSYELLLPHSGEWEFHLVAIDAMGNESIPSSPITVIISTEADNVYLPIVRNLQP